MKFKNCMIALGFIFSITSCENTENKKLIIGHWVGTEWLADGKPTIHNVAETNFTFDEKGNYTYTSSGIVEKGTYRIENDMLLTKPDNQTEIKVRIAKLSGDTLVFDMNRSGASEILTLHRTK